MCQGEAIVLRVARIPVYGVAPARPRAGARHGLRTGKIPQVLDTHVLAPCVDFESEIPGGPGAKRRRLDRIWAGPKNQRYVLLTLSNHNMIDYRFRALASYQIQIGPRVRGS